MVTRGRFITLEGTEGAGKSTQLAAVRAWLEAQNIDHDVTREPGGTPLAEQIREIIKAHHDEAMPGLAELLLMFAARSVHLENRIRPALADGRWVICDRFTDATYAYQGAARGLGAERVAMLEDWVQNGLQPDLTLLLDVPVETGMARARERGAADRFETEQAAFFERVREAYLVRAKADPERIKIIDASVSIEQVTAQVDDALSDARKRWEGA